mmetsp:Transcript_26575/g.40333  ORF Transcript_26575/g.40333 Transcript_26575/m.40333 type:complete len:668 (+) Transcript_26575:281-2284(+)|eukprot:CAMPEP_0194239658 /NCGR_PEP_ID=MMETSP0158-20130606/6053_1 /TAXON_ID=33649 /ORGANISM="Thalassionema nitzschioides, Strain L26-B" /LENGTH=667 /DNA_ID=CAMNT_0038974181 /DNA_START=198 /DNA_END=2201 /DNA_ORIENTATION=+
MNANAIAAAITTTTTTTSIKKRNASSLDNEKIQPHDTITTTTTTKRFRIDTIETRSVSNTTTTKTTTNNHLNLIDDVFSIVMSLLAPREMLRLSLCSKSLTKMVTYEDVVRNAILTGGHGRNSLRRIMELLKKGQIHFPSPLRLLRITCGQKCEIPNCPNTVHTIRAQFGVFCCFPCIQSEALTQSIAHSGIKEGSDEKFCLLLHHPRTARYECKRKITLWRKPFQTAAGEWCGPLITYESIQKHQLLLLQQNNNENSTIKQQQQEDDANLNPLLLDSTADISNHNHHYSYDAKLYQLLLQMDETAMEKATTEESKERKAREARVQKYRRLKLEKLESTVVKIQALLDPRWKELALQRHYCSNDGEVRYQVLAETQEYNPRFECQLVQHMKCIRNLIQAPRRHSSQKKIIKMADAIGKIFEQIYEYGFHDFSFLLLQDKGEINDHHHHYHPHDTTNNYCSTSSSSSCFEVHLHKVLTSMMPVERWLLNLRPDDVSLMEEYGPLLGLACKLEGERTITKPPTFFALAVVSYCVTDDNDKRYTDEAFARALWSLKTHYISSSRRQQQPWTTPSFRYHCQKTFQDTARSFTMLRPKLLQYIHHRDSIDFLKENVNGRSNSWLRVKKEELNSVWVNTRILKSLLRGREVDFASLRREHASKAESRWLGGYW